MSIEPFVDACRRLPPSKWNLHESFFAHKIKLNATTDKSVDKRITTLINALTSPENNPRKRRSESTHLTSKCNDRISVIKHGKTEYFPSTEDDDQKAKLRVPRWFQVTKGDSMVVTISNQLLLVRHVMGTANKGLDDETKARRIKTWKGWYRKDTENGFYSFQEHDLPVLAEKFEDFWDKPFTRNENGALDNTCLNAISKEIRTALLSSNCAPKRGDIIEMDLDGDETDNETDDDEHENENDFDTNTQSDSQRTKRQRALPVIGMCCCCFLALFLSFLTLFTILLLYCLFLLQAISLQ